MNSSTDSAQDKKVSLDLLALGLKCGLEIHQQLDTKKLFCECDSDISQGLPSQTVVRMLRASAGEQGEVDVASKSEMQRGKYFQYQLFPKTTCLVDIDEEPIHDINQEALAITVQVSQALGAKIAEVAQVMRKTVVDGSNTSGFQRTALIARNGSIKFPNKTISIPTICVEEEAAKIVERNSDFDVYDLSRLGIPLLEIATGPDISSAKEAKDVAEHIGMILRSTGKVKRGLGTIRQDLNVSIVGGRRIEIKGAQDLRLIPLLVEKEAHRQYHLLELAKDMKSKNLRKYSSEQVNLTDIFKDSSSAILRKALDSNGIVLGMKVPGMAGLFGMELTQGHRFGSECADYARIEAGVSGIFHSDELPSSEQSISKYGISFADVVKVKRALQIKGADAFVLVAASESRSKRALDSVRKRVHMAFDGVPSEVRKANDDGTTSYLRPMPGAARMYPETDCELIAVPKSNAGSLELITDKIKRLELQGLNKEFATQIAKGTMLSTFEYFAAKFPELEPLFIAKTLLLSPKEIESRLKLETKNLTKDVFEVVLSAVHDKSISREAAFEIMVEVCKGEPINIAKYQLLSDEQLEYELKKIIELHPKMPFNALIGKAMGQLRGRADGKKIADKLKQLFSA